MSERRDELAGNLDAVRRRIEAAASVAGRDPADVTLVAVTKFFPASDVRLLAELGVTDVGENRHQEARPRRPTVPTSTCAGTSSAAFRATRPPPWRRTPTWSSRSTARSWSVRSTGVRTSRPGPVDVLLQVSLDPPGREGRQGADPDDLDALAAAVDEAGMLRLRGLMAVAPLGEDPAPAYAPADRDPARVRGHPP